jgi:hypothetical protein
MISTGLEVLGFISAVAGAAVTWGLGAALFVAAPCLLFMGFAAEGAKVPRLRLKRWKRKA